MDGVPTLVENRGGESTLGNLVADVQSGPSTRRHARVQIAFMNPGGLRADLRLTGAGHVPEAANVQPFANTLVTLQITGRRSSRCSRSSGSLRLRTSVPQARHQQGAHLHLRPDGARWIAHHRDAAQRNPIDPASSTRSVRTRSSRRVATTSPRSARESTRPTAARSTSRRWSTTSPSAGDDDRA